MFRKMDDVALLEIHLRYFLWGFRALFLLDGRNIPIGWTRGFVFTPPSLFPKMITRAFLFKRAKNPLWAG